MDMLTFLKDRGIDIYEYGSARDKHITKGWAQMKCPICGSDRLWLGYNLDKHYFVCYNHGHANIYSLFRAWFPDENTKQLLQTIDKDDTVALPSSEINVPTGTLKPPQWIIPLSSSPDHCEYLRNRGLNPDVLEQVWKISAICGCPARQFMNRIFVPVHNSEGKCVSWLTRSIDPENKYRYIAASPSRETTPLKTLLYGEQFMTMYKSVIVTEGVFDALRIGRNAVATFGKKITKEQFDRIRKYRRRIICFDGETETQIQAKELMRALSIYPGVTDNVCLDAPDPGSAPQEEIDKLLEYIGD